MPNMKKTTIYLGKKHEDRVDEIREALEVQDHAPAIRWAIMNCKIPHKK